MTETMLEKAARALFEREWNGSPPITEWEDVGTKAYWVESARAALEAIRDVDQKTMYAGGAAVQAARNGTGEAVALASFAAMIDAILTEDQGSRPATPPVPTEQTAWVVLGSSGQWSDWSQWPVAVILDEVAAKDEVARLSAASRQLWSERPEPHYDENDMPTEGCDVALEAWAQRVSALDPGADEYDQPNYTACAVPLRTTTPPSQAQDGYEADAIGEVNQASSPPEQP